MARVRGQTALVTGAAGFVGAHLVAALAAENDVVALDHFRSNDPDCLPDEATIVEGDVRDEATLRRAAADVDVIFHQAAARGAAASIEEPVESHAVNVDATLALLEVAREVDARVVVASSAAVYGEPSSLPVGETEPKRPKSPYGIQKLTVDRYARRWNDLYGLETVVLRYFNLYGRRASASTIRGAVGTFVRQAREGQLTIVGDGSQTRDFVHVSDAVRANLRAATTEHVGRAYNVGSGTATAIEALARLVRDRVNPDAELTHTEARPREVRASRADLTRARAELGYEPTVDLASRLRDGELPV